VKSKRLTRLAKNNDLHVDMKIGRIQCNQNFGWLIDTKIYGLLSGRFKLNTALNFFSSHLEIAKHNG